MPLMFVEQQCNGDALKRKTRNHRYNSEEAFNY
jgi:hypothetical protein